MLDIRCPNCNEISKISLIEDRYNDPFRCWKCNAVFMVEIEENELKSAVSISKEDFDNWHEMQQLKKING